MIAATQNETSDNNLEIVVHYIKKDTDYKWTKEELTVSGDSEIRQRFLNDIRQKFNKGTH